MATQAIRFRVESNKAKSTFWYTMVAGNGNTVMTSKAKYYDEHNARRAARRAAKAIVSAPVVVEYQAGDGQWVTESVTKGNP